MAKKPVSFLLILIFAAMPGLSALAHCMPLADHCAESGSVLSEDRSFHSALYHATPVSPDHQTQAPCHSDSNCMHYHCCGFPSAHLHRHAYRSPACVRQSTGITDSMLYAPEIRPPIALI